MPLRSFGDEDDDDDEEVDDEEDNGDLGDEVIDAGDGGVCSNTGRDFVKDWEESSDFDSSSLPARFLQILMTIN